MKLPTLPPPAVLGQALGLVAFLVGLFLLAGLAWALLTGGLLALLWGCVAEAVTVATPPPLPVPDARSIEGAD